MFGEDLDLEQAAERIAYLEDLVKKYKYCKLTGLMKDQDFDDEFHKVFEGFQFTGEKFTLIIADINYLHNVNKQGWKEGNKLIVSVADQLKAIFPQRYIFRIGGDEFCIVVRQSTVDCEAVERQMNEVTNITYVATQSNGYVNPSRMFKQADEELTKLKLARPDLEERL